MSVFAGLFLFAAAFYGVVLWMFVVRRGIAWAVALIAASATFGAWLVAFVLTFIDYQDADGFIDCGTDCSGLQRAVGGTLWWGLIALALFALLTGIAGKVVRS